MVKTQTGTVVKARPRVNHGQDPVATQSIWVVNGRMVSKTLADPEIQKKMKEEQHTRYPDRAALIKEMHRRGVLTRTGKVSAKYGG